MPQNWSYCEMCLRSRWSWWGWQQELTGQLGFCSFLFTWCWPVASTPSSCPSRLAARRQCLSTAIPLLSSSFLFATPSALSPTASLSPHLSTKVRSGITWDRVLVVYHEWCVSVINKFLGKWKLSVWMSKCISV